jgi:hypothetical protein
MKRTLTFLIVGIFSLVFFSNTKAQITQDTTLDFEAPVDTADFYIKLFEYSKDKKFLYWIYRAVFHPPVRSVKVNKKKRKIPALSEKVYRGKTIRNITVLSLDPFGTNINDTSKKAHNFIQKGGNVIHIESKKSTIKNYLLFKQGDRIDPLELLESERLLRETAFIRDARITVKAVPGTKDSFDIHIITQDYWSIVFDLDATTNKVRYRVTERNMLGLGHEFDNKFTDDLTESNPLVIDGSYKIPTISNTYISPVIYYGTGPDNNIRGLTVNRPFYSPLTQVAGGLDILSLNESDSINLISDTMYYYTFRSFVTDGWMGYSMKLLNGQTNEERSTRIVAAVRFARTRYPELEPESPIVKEHFSRSDLYLGSISLSSRKYLRQKYVLKFGEVEDVPDGTKLTFTGGFENRLTGTQQYFGIDGAIGHYFDSFGYLYLGSGYSTFIKGDELFQSSITANVIYFSPLAVMKRWRVRQFANFSLIYGINRRHEELLKLNSDDGLPGFKSDLPEGTSRMVLVGQTVFYTPYEFLGFRFAPIIIAGIGMVGNYNSSVLRSKVYQMYGIGLLVKNELLILNTFQVILAFYPSLPDGSSGFRVNPVSLTESRFKDFDITKPDVSPFE